MEKGCNFLCFWTREKVSLLRLFGWLENGCCIGSWMCFVVTLWGFGYVKKEEAFLYFFCSVFGLEKWWIFSGLFRLYFWSSKGVGVAAIEAGCLQFRVGEKEGFFWVFWVMQWRFVGVSLGSSCDGVSWFFVIWMFSFQWEF